MSQKQRTYLRFAILLVAVVDAGCASSDERLHDIPLAAEQYDPMDHFPPSSDPDGPLIVELERIRALLRDRKFGPASATANI